MNEAKEKFCIVCGRRIPKTSERRKLCGIACEQSRRRGYAPYIKMKAPPFDELTQLQQKAQAQNMSYGQYMAAKYSRAEKNGTTAAKV